MNLLCLSIIVNISSLSVLVHGQRKERVPDPEDTPDILLIIGDDISCEDFGCYGNPAVKTPNRRALQDIPKGSHLITFDCNDVLYSA
jgi:hypothetical protein